MKIACFYDFLRKNQFLPIFYTQNGHFSIFVGALTLWRHSDVIHQWFVLILVSMERGCPYLYTGSKFRVIWPSVLIIQRGVATTPLRKICLGKTLRRTRVNQRSKVSLGVKAIEPLMVNLPSEQNLSQHPESWMTTNVDRELPAQRADIRGIRNQIALPNSWKEKKTNEFNRKIYLCLKDYT